jgi:beta-1,4-mannosyltransferase
MIIEPKVALGRSLNGVWGRTSALARVPGHDTAMWVFAPHFVGNPYQELLTMALPEYGIAAVGASSLDVAVPLLTDASPTIPRILHLHWLNGILHKAKSEEDGAQRVDAFARTLDSLIAKGVRIVWTMHNVLPHESRYVNLEVRVREIIVDRAEMIHIMNPDSVALADEYFKIPPEKVVQVEHPGYQGYYPTWMRRDAARISLGVTPDEHLALIVGAIKPYKGLLDLAREVDALSRRHPRRLSLLIAGSASQDEETSALLDLAATHPAINVWPDRISTEAVGLLFCAADTALIPYRASLNSGSLVLGVSMQTPVIATPTAGSTHLLAAGAGRTYSSNDQLADLLINDSWVDQARPAAAAAAEQIHPHVVSRVFAEVARAFIDGGVPSVKSERAVSERVGHS